MKKVFTALVFLMLNGFAYSQISNRPQKATSQPNSNTRPEQRSTILQQYQSQQKQKQQYIDPKHQGRTSVLQQLEAEERAAAQKRKADEARIALRLKKEETEIKIREKNDIQRRYKK